MKYFKDLDNDITTESNALKEWLTTPTITLEKGVDAIVVSYIDNWPLICKNGP